MKTYRTCYDCPRQLRPMGTLKVDHPGTYSNHWRGLCSNCWEARRDNGTLEEVPLRQSPSKSHCQGTCGRPLRNKNKTLAERPGTVANVGNSMCSACARALIPDKAPVIDTEAPGADTLNAYMRGRAARLARGKKLAAIRAKYGIAA